MKRIGFILGISFALLLVIGCSAHAMSRPRRRTWRDYNYHELVAKKGKPIMAIDDANGHKILVYESNRQWLSTGQFTTTYDMSESMRYTSFFSEQNMGYLPCGYMAYDFFWIRKDGNITRWAWVPYPKFVGQSSRECMAY